MRKLLMALVPAILLATSLAYGGAKERRNDLLDCAGQSDGAARVAACTRLIVANHATHYSPSSSSKDISTLYYFRGWTSHHMGDDEHAIADLKEAILFDPRDWQAFDELGFIYWLKGDADKARTYYYAVLAIEDAENRTAENEAFIHSQLDSLNRTEIEKATAEERESLKRSSGIEIERYRSQLEVSTKEFQDHIAALNAAAVEREKQLATCLNPTGTTTQQ